MENTLNFGVLKLISKIENTFYRAKTVEVVVNNFPLSFSAQTKGLFTYFKNMGFEEKYTETLTNLITRQDVVLDCGGYVGFHTTCFASTGAKVYVAEPDPFFAKQIQSNTQLNHLDNITIIQEAVLDTKGQVKFQVKERHGWSSRIKGMVGKNDTKRDYHNEINVSTTSLDLLIGDNKIEIPTVIKMDVEGAEFYALSGAKDLLSSDHKPRVIAIEIHPTMLDSIGHSQQDVERVIEDAGYTRVFCEDRRDEVLNIYLLKN